MTGAHATSAFFDLALWSIVQGTPRQPMNILLSSTKQVADRLVVAIVDDDGCVRSAMKSILELVGFEVWTFASAREFLDHPPFAQSCCLIVDIRMPDMDGFALHEELLRRGTDIPVIVVTGYGDVPLAVRAMKAGAVDFLEKPYTEELLVSSVQRAFALTAEASSKAALSQAAKDAVDSLTDRERDVFGHLIAGRSNKVIAYELDISPRTVEVYRSRVMNKMHAHSLAELIRRAVAAGFNPGA